MGIVKYHDDWDMLLECASPLFVVAAIITNLTCSLWNSQKIFKLLSRVRTDWQVWAHDREVNILHEYAEQGRNMAIMYVVTVFPTGILFMIQPVIPKIIDIFLKNGSELGVFPIPYSYYHIDEQKYYFHIMLHAVVCVSYGLLVIVATDAMFIVFVQHGCGIFAALGHKLERIQKSEGSSELGLTAHALDKRDREFKHLVTCVNRHNDAIEYANLIEATYSWGLLFIVGFNMLIISVSGLQIVKRTVDLEETARFIACIVAAVGHLFIDSYLSQMLMDHSINIRDCLFNNKWYRLSLKTQKLLQLILMRSNAPSKLTAGKISTMSVETFGVFMKTSLSYFTVLRTM